VFSYLGSFGGGSGILPLGPDILLIAVFATVIYVGAIHLRLPQEKFARYMAQEKIEELAEYGTLEDDIYEGPFRKTGRE
jgi:hypothetical protein